MKKKFIFSLAVAMTFSIAGHGAWAQDTATNEFTLEEILVTAEKREVIVQKLPSSVVAIEGGRLVEQGKITTQQILEGVPNVTLSAAFANVGITAATPDAGIAIRGVKFKQTSDGQPAAATATYVDGIFQGIGGNYDIDRVEILRGPQGTLYGRSATGGVVSFHTKDPMLSEFGVSATAEFGKANLMNFQAALNAPYGDEFALRAAWHHYERDGYYNKDGGYSRTSEGRIKALWNPTEEFDIMLTVALADRLSNSGGSAAQLVSGSPDSIDYDAIVTDVVEGAVRRSTMYALTSNYDFGPSLLTYIGSYRYYEDLDSPPATMIRPGSQIMHNQFYNYGENFYTHELRLASDTDGMLSWLVGANYYNSDYDRLQQSKNHRAFIAEQGGIEDPNPATRDAPIFEMPTRGEITNFGIFTEETFDMTDVFRITAGLRYDETTVDAYSAFNLNANENEYRHAMNPPDWIFFGMERSIDFDNVTYKLRLEYDLTPDNMLYALTATGFQPGDLRLTNKFDPAAGGFVFFALPYDEEKLTTYEVGSKNRFLGNTLQLNISGFFYDYEGYRYTVNTALAGPPVFAVLPIPLEMKGAEFDIAWMPTANGLLSFAAGWVDAKITGYPDIPEINPTSQWIKLKRVPGIPEITATLSYDHTFNLPNGSTLVPRAEVRFTKGMYIENLNQSQYDTGVLPYNYQDDYYVADVGATWTSANDMFSVTGYVRNITDEEYKAALTISGGPDAIGVTPGDPRAWGLVLSAKY